MVDWQEDTGVLSDVSTAIEDRRDSPRQPAPAEGTRIWMYDGRRLAVEVVDESVEGVGILIAGGQSFALGPRVQVDCGPNRREATVAHIVRREDGAYRVGLTWTCTTAANPCGTGDHVA